MKTRLLYFLSFLAALTLTGCPDPPCFNPDPSYSFAVTAHFTPDKDSIQIGDTLYLVSEFPSTMIPIGGQEPVGYTHSTGIGNSLGIVELTETSKRSADAVNSFDYINVDGLIYNSKDIPSPGRFQQLKYKEVSDKYLLKVGFIPKKKGIYLIGIGSGLSNGRKTGDKCTKASFQTTLTNKDPHLYYYEDWSGLPMDPFATNISYLFKVY